MYFLIMKKFLLGNWKGVLAGLVVMGLLFYVYSLQARVEITQARAEKYQVLAKAAASQLKVQNRAIAKLANGFKELSENLGGIEKDSNESRKKLDKALKTLDSSIIELLSTPPAATPEEACKIATNELRKTDEVKILLPRSTN